MLRSVVLRYGSRAGGSLPYECGRAMHAAFLEAVARVCPEVAERLHGGSGFTTAVIAGLAADGEKAAGPRKGTTLILPRSVVEIRLTSFDHELSQRLDEIAAGMLRLRLGPILVELASPPLVSPAEHGFAVGGSLESLARFWLEDRLGDAQPVFGGARLDFLSPVVFRHSGQDAPLPLPLPSLLFARLRRIWNCLGLAQVTDEDAVRLVDGCRIRRYDLRTCEVRLSERAVHTGFTGWCELGFPDEQSARVGHLLLDLGYFTGIGAKTTMGCGALAPVGHFGVLRRQTQPNVELPRASSLGQHSVGGKLARLQAGAVNMNTRRSPSAMIQEGDK